MHDAGTASVGGAGAAVRSMASATTAPHFNTKAINRAKEQAALRGRPDPFEVASLAPNSGALLHPLQ